ncbi:unnamed protein product, partial [marine sediment metagenome]
MHECIGTICRVQPLLLGVNAAERWDGLRRFAGSGGSNAWLWWALIPIALVAVVGVGVWIVHRSRQERRRWAEFRTRAKQVGLRDPEFRLLRFMVRRSELRGPATVYTIESTFGRVVTRLMRSKKVSAMSEKARSDLDSILESIGEKLGFELPLVAEEPEVLTRSEQIAVGSSLLITVPGVAAPFAATLTENEPERLLVETETPVDVRP